MWRIRDVYPGSRNFFSSRIRTVSIPDPGSSLKNLSILTPKKAKKWFLSSKKYDPSCSSRIPDPDADFLPSRIPDPGVKKAPNPGSRIRIRIYKQCFLAIPIRHNFFRIRILPPTSINIKKSRIRIRKSVLRIRVSGSVPICHGSTSMIIRVCLLSDWRVGDSSFFWNTAAAVNFLTGKLDFVTFVECFKSEFTLISLSWGYSNPVAVKLAKNELIYLIANH